MQEAADGAGRDKMVAAALRLVTVSVVFGVVSGTVSVVVGLGTGSLGVFAVGLGVLADVTGSAVLIWRFRAEQRQPGPAGGRERLAAFAVAAALAVVAAALTTGSVTALVRGSHPGTSRAALIVAGVSVVVLTPLAVAKRRVGRRIGSLALQGDGTLSGIGAATSLLALAALVLYRTLGWWQADRGAALVVAGIAAAGAWRTMPRQR